MTNAQEGRVASFDDFVGLGLVDGADGQSIGFHCTQISDGSRTIAVGTPVTFAVVAGHLGRWEATRVRPGSWCCPVCGSVNDGRPRAYEICTTCGWEDDPVQFEHLDATGANRESLTAARRDWAATLAV